ncbi:DUF104 domain-containing protein [Pyrococcus furiosus DSM 3638]|uniref:Antitoxin n=2 Tax=Pyrococcus furiosus TaxID=2261 RepID=A0A5C0XQU0_PYRFU|nr:MULTISPECIES: antitoxin family protein [Pyrococcus]AFN04245.1 hypothetical protein PFC_06545 [Pyrococcus furiosus COM1]MDK2869491.1 hypothetical protein [Pyrococcus sp.]QEK79091.1 DUF104 domain-containing protein [Pyrococcus furiosus DSM 3638]
MKVRVVYERGVFRPIESVELEEGTTAEVVILEKQEKTRILDESYYEYVTWGE